MKSETLSVQFTGNHLILLREVAVGGLLTLLSFGIYKSWMKTRLRRWYWSSISIGGQPLEYVGRGSEKFMGFLAAIAFLAVYICVVNVLLIYGSFRLAYAAHGGTIAAVIGILPVAIYAQWRGRAYIYSRTRWRGIRFALEGSAWGYVWRSIAGALATVLSLGLLLPWMVFLREKYMTDRTWFGSIRLTQGGDWTMLLPGVVILVPAVAASALVILLGRLVEPLILYALWVTIPSVLIGFAYFRACSFRVLTNLKEAGGMRLAAAPPTWRIALTAFLGISITTGFLAGATALLTDGFQTGLSNMGLMELMAFYVNNTAQWLVLILIFLSAIVVYTIWGVMSHLLVLLPLARLYAESMRIEHAERLAFVRQRKQVDLRGADGLFETLDLGAGL